MVETSSLRRAGVLGEIVGVGDMNGFALVGNLVAVAWNGIDTLKTVYFLGQKLQV